MVANQSALDQSVQLVARASRRNILFVCKAFYVVGISMFYMFSVLDLRLGKMKLPNRYALRDTRQIFLDGCQMQASTIVLLFPALRHVTLAPTTFITTNFHVKYRGHDLLPMVNTVWYRAAHAAVRSASRPLVMEVRFKWKIAAHLSYFPPGQAYDIVSTLQSTL